MKPNNDVTETLRCTGMGETVNKKFQKNHNSIFLKLQIRTTNPSCVLQRYRPSTQLLAKTELDS